MSKEEAVPDNGNPTITKFIRIMMLIFAFVWICFIGWIIHVVHTHTVSSYTLAMKCYMLIIAGLLLHFEPVSLMSDSVRARYSPCGVYTGQKRSSAENMIGVINLAFSSGCVTYNVVPIAVHADYVDLKYAIAIIMGMLAGTLLGLVMRAYSWAMSFTFLAGCFYVGSLYSLYELADSMVTPAIYVGVGITCLIYGLVIQCLCVSNRVKSKSRIGIV